MIDMKQRILNMQIIKFFIMTLFTISLLGCGETKGNIAKRCDFLNENTFEACQKAAEQRDADAQFNLGVMYHNGEGVTQDYKQAVKWYTLAAEQGYADAQFNLGVMYHNGEGVTQDYKQAVKWYTLGAEQGDADSQFILGLIYKNGTGVTQDYKQTIKWHTLAAEQGYADAQHYLGLMYQNGRGFLQDNAYSHMWFNIASSNGNSQATENRDIIAERMTKGQIAEAQKLARECVAKDYKDC
jgi:TPR repeat protein